MANPTRVQLYRRGPIWYVSYWVEGTSGKWLACQLPGIRLNRLLPISPF